MGVSHQRKNQVRSSVLFFAALLAAACGLSIAGEQRCEGSSKRDISDFVFLGDGSQILDKKTNLIWMRCIEDQTWTRAACRANDPNAVNPGPRTTYEQARKLAVSKSSPEQTWRIPTQKELLTLREPNCYNPSMSVKLFPTEPAWSSDGSFWTSTPQAKGRALVSAIGTSDSWSTTEPSKTNHVRLVRTLPTERK
jgi:Protein of unknown function (DUF1566)